jgi:hypothetical protein
MRTEHFREHWKRALEGAIGRVVRYGCWALEISRCSNVNDFGLFGWPVILKINVALLEEAIASLLL